MNVILKIETKKKHCYNIKYILTIDLRQQIRYELMSLEIISINEFQNKLRLGVSHLTGFIKYLTLVSVLIV